MSQPPKCTGPFSNAFDCPVHDPRKLPGTYSERGAGVVEGEQTILHQLARANVFIFHPQGLAQCWFCGKHTPAEWAASNVKDHPSQGDSKFHFEGCLALRAHTVPGV